jgi:hypothetical protein
MTLVITIYRITFSIKNIIDIETTNKEKSGIKLNALFSSSENVAMSVIRNTTLIINDVAIFILICDLRYVYCPSANICK